jgi:hypothetical protein
MVTVEHIWILISIAICAQYYEMHQNNDKYVSRAITFIKLLIAFISMQSNKPDINIIGLKTKTWLDSVWPCQTMLSSVGNIDLFGQVVPWHKSRWVIFGIIPFDSALFCHIPPQLAFFDICYLFNLKRPYTALFGLIWSCSTLFSFVRPSSF